MKITYELGVDDIQKIIAEHFKVDASDVCITTKISYIEQGSMAQTARVPVCYIKKELQELISTSVKNEAKRCRSKMVSVVED